MESRNDADLSATSNSSRRSSLTHRRPDRPPDGLGGDRQGHVADAEIPQRIDHGVADGGRRADGAGLAAALDAERVGRRRRLDEGAVDARQIARPRHGIVHEGSRQELA